MRFVRLALRNPIVSASFAAWVNNRCRGKPKMFSYSDSSRVWNRCAREGSGSNQRVLRQSHRVSYESKYRDSREKVYGARSQTEAAIYVATGVVESQRITIVGPVWGDAYHLKRMR